MNRQKKEIIRDEMCTVVRGYGTGRTAIHSSASSPGSAAACNSSDDVGVDGDVAADGRDGAAG